MGINVDEVYAGNVMNAAYIKAKPGSQMTLKVVGSEIRAFGDEDEEKKQKVVLHFLGEDKMLSLNVTNKNIIRDSWGPDTDAWANRWLRVFVHRVNFQGKMIDGVAVECVAGPSGADLSLGSDTSSTVFGINNAERLIAKLRELGPKFPSANTEALRAILVVKHPELAAVLGGEIANWPRSIGGEVKAWLDEVQSLPF